MGENTEPVLTYTPRSKTLDVGDAEQVQGYEQGSIESAWVLTTEPYPVEAPAGGNDDTPQPTTTIAVAGPPLLPSLTIDMQRLGAARWRQGWSEFTTSDDAPQPTRYKTLTALAGANAPAGSLYSGSLSLGVPPPRYDPYSYPPRDDQGHPQAGLPVIRPGDFKPPQRPLVIYDTLSADAEAVTPNPVQPAAYQAPDLLMPTDGATVLNPEARALNSPAGLVLLLSTPQSPGEIGAQVSAVAGGAWPVPHDGVYLQGEYVPAWNGAGNYRSASGDFCAAQKARYKLTHFSNDARTLADTSYSFTSKWLLRHRNLDTGVVTDEPQEETITLQGSHNSHTDEDWREIPVPGGNETIEVVLLPGKNEDPHTFGGIVATLVAGDDDDDGGDDPEPPPPLDGAGL